MLYVYCILLRHITIYEHLKYIKYPYVYDKKIEKYILRNLRIANTQLSIHARTQYEN